MKRFIALIFLTVGIINTNFAQVGVGTTTPDSSSILDIRSTNKGVLFPKVTLQGPNTVAPLTNPAKGLIVWNTGATWGTPGFYYNDSNSVTPSWVKIAAGAVMQNTLTNGKVWIGNATNIGTEQTMSGDFTMTNTGVSDITNDSVSGAKINITGNTNGSLMYYDGTDWVNLAPDTAGKILRTNGAGAPTWVNANTLNVNNIYTTDGALTGARIVTIGANSLTFRSTAVNGFSVDTTTFSVDATNNRVGIGTIAPSKKLDVVGGDAIINGVTVGLGNNSAVNNTALGNNALLNNTTGTMNTASGFQSLRNNSTGQASTAHGYNSLISNTTGTFNTGIGANSLLSNSTGGNNTAIGVASLQISTIGSNNTGIGGFALNTNTIGSQNTALGYGADVLSNNLTNATAIGFNTKVGSSNSLVLGNNANVGIGTSTPTSKLHVVTSTIPNTIMESNSAIGTWLSIGNTDTVGGVGGKWFDIISTGHSNGEGVGKLIFTRALGPTLTSGTIMTMDWTNFNVGIGTTSPAASNKLEVVGKTKTTNFQMTSGATNDYILKSDSFGNGTWVNPNTLTVSNIYTADGALTGARVVTMGNNDLTFNNTNGNLRVNTTGTGNVAMGNNLTVTGANSFVSGQNNTVSGVNSTVSGSNNNVSGNNNAVSGQNNVVAGSHSNVSGISNNENGIDNVVGGTLNYVTPGFGHSIVVGNSDTIAGSATAVFGFKNKVTAFEAFAQGDRNTASGQASAVFGTNNVASGFTSYVIGDNNIGSGNLSLAGGSFNRAPSYAEISLGTFGTTYTPISATAINAADRLINIGNGTSTGARADAFTILKSGFTGIGTASPNKHLEVSGTGSEFLRISDLLPVSGEEIGIEFYKTGGVGTWTDWKIASVMFGGNFEISTSGVDNFGGPTITRLAITPGGNVGIGTITPGTKLEVAGNTKTTNFQMTSGATNGYILKSDASGNGSWVNPNSTLTKKDVITTTTGVSIVNGTSQVVGDSNVTINIATNSSTSPGLVSSAAGQNTKVWGTDASGNPNWKDVGTLLDAQNGLRMDTTSPNASATQPYVELGGPLVRNTTITQGNFNYTQDMTGTGMYRINHANTNPVSTNTFPFGVNRAGSTDFTIGSDATYAYMQTWNSKPLQINNQGNNVILNPNSGSVGIGTTGITSGALFEVFKNNSDGGTWYGEKVSRFGGNTATGYGVHSTSKVFPGGGTGGSFYGVYGEAQFGNNSYGVYGKALYGITGSYGLYGEAISSGAFGVTNYGVYGTAANGTTNWAGYFVGNGYFSGNVGIGTTTPNAPLQFANSIANRKIVLWDGSNNDHQFYGIGVNNLTLRYQVDGTGSNHIFYAGTSTSTSNELMRIQGNGNVGIGGTPTTYKLEVFNSDASLNGVRVGRGAGNVGSNTVVGTNALNANTTGFVNTAIGTSALNANTTGADNTAIGVNAMFYNTTGTMNSSIGTYSLFGNTTGNYNTGIGKNALYSNTTGSNNTALGYGADVSNGALTNATAIGSNAIVSASNSLVLGNGANVGIGTSTPGQKLSVSGTIEAIDFGAAGSQNLRIGDDTYLTDIDVANSVGLNGIASGTNVNLTLGGISGNSGMVSGGSADYLHGTGNQTFGAGGRYVMAASMSLNGLTSFETGGFFADGNTAAIWSPGDANQGQPSALLYFMDEDSWDAANTNPYDNTALKSYINPAGALVTVSDSSKKQNITKINSALSKIRNIGGYEYQFKLAPNEILKGQKPVWSSGVLAQEVEKQIPTAVEKSEAGDYFVNYSAIIPYFIEAMKEQQNIIDQLKKRLEILESK